MISIQLLEHLGTFSSIYDTSVGEFKYTILSSNSSEPTIFSFLKIPVYEKLAILDDLIGK